MTLEEMNALPKPTEDKPIPDQCALVKVDDKLGTILAIIKGNPKYAGCHLIKVQPDAHLGAEE